VAEATNHFPERGYALAVRDTFEYQGVAGAPSKKTTGFLIGGTPNEQFVTTLGTDPAGQVTSIGYPTCTGGLCGSPGAPSRTVTATYANGWLTSLPGHANFSWHANGVVSNVTHANGVNDWYAIDGTTWEPRVRTIQSWNTNNGTPLFISGDYQYDTAGNVAAIGNHRYRYDGVSRLIESSEDWGVPLSCLADQVDRVG
jgi:hypothetical protein